MNALAADIQSRNLTGTPAEIQAAYAAAGEPLTDSTSYSLSGLATQLAIQGVPLSVLVELRSYIANLPIGGNTLEGFLIAGGGESGGVDCSRADIRYQIGLNQAALAGVEQTATVQAQLAILAGMLLVGSSPRTVWQEDSIPSLPSTDQIIAALAEIEAEAAITAQGQLRVWLRQQCDLIDLRILSGELTTQADVQAAWGDI